MGIAVNSTIVRVNGVYLLHGEKKELLLIVNNEKSDIFMTDPMCL